LPINIGETKAQGFTLGWIDITVFAAFVAAVISVGLIKSKGESGSEDYFLAGRGLKWWLIGFSLIAANISTEQFVGMSGSAAGSLGQLAFLDNRVREIYQALESGGLLEDTVLIFTSDHGDLVGQHGIPEAGYPLNASSYNM
jgi:hypothetical protein